MSTYDYYTINYNKLKKRLWKQNESNIELKFDLQTTKAQFKDTFSYFKKESHRIK